MAYSTVIWHSNHVSVILPDRRQKVQDSMFKKLLLFLPIFGDDLLPVNILRAVERGLFPKDVTVMLGVTPDEGTTILTTWAPSIFEYYAALHSSKKWRKKKTWVIPDEFIVRNSRFLGRRLWVTWLVAQWVTWPWEATPRETMAWHSNVTW